ncbi:hypothetical protein [Microcystis aeruginosa]|uniref:hypothetical protein n=1 Tax=Microcystis aeruginosa TaxID=1126 RepID=UPI0009302E61|nr:hypothetical protein [Microcystis aeruginosa]
MGKTPHPTPHTPHPAPTKNFFSSPYLFSPFPPATRTKWSPHTPHPTPYTPHPTPYFPTSYSHNPTP